MPVSRLTFGCFWIVAAVPALAVETVLEDSPSRLLIEVSVAGYQVEAGVGGSRIAAAGFSGAGRFGSPDLPWYRFQVASGKGLPVVSVEAQEWEELSVPGGLAGVPRYVTSRKPEAFKDAALFSAAVRLSSQVSEAKRFRGLSLRHVALPLGTYDGAGRARLLKRFRVRVEFPDAGLRPGSGAQAWLSWAGVKNAKGGAYLTSLSRRPLGKITRAGFTLGDTTIKIRIGDRVPDAFAEDGAYALAYETALAATRSIQGARIPQMRMYAGPKDTLAVTMNDSAGALPPTLREIPIEVEDNNRNGTFDEGDRILFYAHGSSVWKPVPKAQKAVRWEFGLDPYSFDNFYYLDWSNGAAGSRLAVSSPLAPGQNVTAAPHYLRAEREENTGSCDPSGRIDEETGFEWYWHWKGVCYGVDTTVTLYPSQLQSPTTDSLEGYAGDSVWMGFFTFLDLNGNFRVTGAPGSPWVDAEPDSALRGDWVLAQAANNGRLGIASVDWNGYNHRFEGYSVRYSRKLEWKGQARTVFPAETGKRVTYQIQGGGGLRCLRVEKGAASGWIPIAVSGNDGAFTDSAGEGEDVVYQLFRDPMAVGIKALSVEAPSGGAVRNLTTGDGLDPEYLVVSPQALLPEAVDFAKYREASQRMAPLRAAVVRLEDVYREWSGGRLSPMAIRDMLRWALQHWGGGGPGRLKYVLLMGDGHYDYRNFRNLSRVDSLPIHPNHVPPFNWDDQDDANPMNTDDFYGVLDGTQTWQGGFQSVALGRIPAQTREQARDYLDKVKAFEMPKQGEEWRSRVTLTADDITQRGMPNDADPVNYHTNQSEALGRVVSSREPGIRLEKVYLLDYPRNASWLKPEATADLIGQINQGTSLITFMGHGAYNQWADEVFLQTNDALSRMRNAGKPFLIAVFSCTVGRFDKLLDEGMTEQFVKQKDFGAIAALAASRESYPGPNQDLGTEFLAREFPGDTLADVPPFGLAVQRAKNALGNDFQYNKEKYVVLGDPALTFRRAHLGIALDAAPDTLQALACGNLTGRIQGGSGHGYISARIISGDIRKVFPVPNGDPFQAQVEMKRGRILFERTVEYKDGAFSIGYFLPKQVPFGDSTAKLQLYAWDMEKPLENTSAKTDLRILGTASGGVCAVDKDGRGPKIGVTGCNVKESGDVDFPDRVKISLPYCLQIEVSDSGGVLSGDGPDEGTTVELSGVREPFHPQAGVDDLYRKTYQLTVQRGEATPGEHVLKVTARDGFGNLSLRQLRLQIAEDSALRFVRVFNAPNPVKRAGTTFYFSTTLPQDEGEALVAARAARVSFDLRIFNQSGRLVREFRDAQSGAVRWDGQDAWGQSLANGVYFYSVTAKWDASQGAPAQGQSTSLRNILVLSR